MKPIIGTAAMAVALAIFSTPAHAQLSGQLGILDLTANGGINPATGVAWQQGDKYHLLFVTTGSTAATSTDIADYNEFVQAEATAEGMGAVNWFALGSTTSTNAINNAVITGPVLNVFNSGTVAIDAADLWDFLFPDGNEMSTLANENKNIWTGTSPGGIANANNELGAANGTTRRHWTGWIDWGPAFATQNNADSLPMVAISQELTIQGPATTFQLRITPNTETPGSYDLEWDSQAGKLYNLRTSTDLTGAISTWTLVEGDIVATPPTNLLTVAPTDEKRFYAVEEFDAPPLLSVDFEENNGGFTVATDEGTAWEHGTPDTAAPGATINSGNNGSANAWATNLGTFASAGATPTDTEKGIYADPTHTALRSPVIDLTNVAGATLTFAEALDFPATDTAVVNLIHATTETIIAQIHQSADDDLNSANWGDVGPINLTAGVGQQVRIEWRFQGTGSTTKDYTGWYIDDVVVTETTP